MSIFSVISLKAHTLSLTFLIVVAALAGCSSSPSLPPQSVSNTVWGLPNDTVTKRVFLPDGRYLNVTSDFITGEERTYAEWGKWWIEGNEIKVAVRYATGYEYVNLKTRERKPQYQDYSFTFRFKGNVLEVPDSGWFSNYRLSKVDITAEKFVADIIRNNTFIRNSTSSPSPSP
jgi:hypothetical protein